MFGLMPSNNSYKFGLLILYAKKMVLKIQAFFSKIGLRLTYNQFKLN